MKRVHAMPFGASVREDGSVSFRLWAPAARSVEIELDGGGREGGTTPPMVRGAGGWHALATAKARAGTRYRFVIDGEIAVPDPASRFQPQDVHGPSEVVDPAAFAWSDADWNGRPWHETVLYEMHVGTFTREGDYASAARRLDHLVDLGITAIELMPLAEAPGGRNWGYDGVLPFAPEHRYGRPEELKRFVEAAHRRGLMVFLDVVYNHFGPEGNYLQRYAPQFFNAQHQTPWGGAINFDGPDSGPVRDFVIHNALYWIEEFHIDGLRLDAVHAIVDDSKPGLLEELAHTVRAGTPPGRHIHLVLENDDNSARLLERGSNGEPRRYTAQWNDDLHHVLHVLATDEAAGYYGDYVDGPHARLARTLAEGFDYQGEASAHRGGRRRGEPSAHLPGTAFVSFLQNHDQIGNRARGERIGALAPADAVRAALSVVLLAPSIPLLFMGDEWNAPHPFLFFCDFGPALADAVRTGRLREFARFPEFATEGARAAIPDPLDPGTFAASCLDWDLPERAGSHRDWLDLVRRLIAVRRREIVPRLAGAGGRAATSRIHQGDVIEVRWRLGGGSTLQAILSFSRVPAMVAELETIGHALFVTSSLPHGGSPPAELPPWFAGWFMHAPGDRS
ncbi:MAG: malto-oligosyltrehalose trehalohydrolase [Alphaproteobacteria bacterium]|nr:malto-oligosyltrehalose trehalohydrolase [Alphaproteobacteria bacterium]